MRNERMALGGALLIGVAAAVVMFPKIGNKARLALRRRDVITHRSGVSNPGTRAKADPARGVPG